MKNNKLKTILTGCILKEDKRKFKKEFDLILDLKDKDYLSIQPKHQTNFRAFVPISNGCNNFCSYCVVPYVRGPEICRNHQKILEEVKNIIEKGFKEIWLLGQNVNDYRSPADPAVDFPKLLRWVNDTPGNFWIRFTSPHPKDFSDELIETMAKCEKVTEYLNLPVQSGDNEILKRMNRLYTIEQYKNLVKKIREKIPDITLSTDVIVGFPGETKEQFENTVKLFEEIKFDMAYIAQYSQRPGTIAAKMKDNISHQEKERRDKILTEVLKKTALDKNKKYIGKTVEVLPEKSKNGFLIGKSRTYKTTKFEGPSHLIGQFIRVKIIDSMPWGLKGKII